MPVTLYAATTNPGKLRDFAVAAAEGGYAVDPLPGIDKIEPPPEDAPTFAGNARHKAEYYSRLVPGFVLADDSGLEVDSLGGEPGVRSARFAEDAGFEPHNAAPNLTLDQRNNLYLLVRMHGVPQRKARYRCALAIAAKGVLLLQAEGLVNGEILTAPRGTGGFGYDPLFWLPQLQRTMAEITPEQKHMLSHRGRAFRNLLPNLKNLAVA